MILVCISDGKCDGRHVFATLSGQKAEMSKPILSVALFLSLLPGFAAAQDESARYASCIQLTQSDPDTAFDRAIAWRDDGGGMPARHCAALALIGLRLYEEGAMRLEELATAPGNATAELRTQILAQASTAWLEAGKEERALLPLDRAVTLGEQAGIPMTTQIMVRLDRAALLIALQQDDKAYGDVQFVLTQPTLAVRQRIEALYIRASIFHGRGDHQAVVNDTSAALDWGGTKAGLYLIRAEAYAGLGYPELARKDLLTFLTQEPNGPQSDTARLMLERLEAFIAEQKANLSTQPEQTGPAPGPDGQHAAP